MPDAEIQQAAFEAVGAWGREALALALDQRWRARSHGETKGTVFDVVTPTDRAIERHLVAAIAARFPDHAILGEEQGRVGDSDRWLWTIDPIDGTFNFLTGLPGAACAIALLRDETVVVGAVADLASGAVYRAQAGGGIVSDLPGWSFDPLARVGVGRARLFLEYGAELLDEEMLLALGHLAAVRPVVPRLVGSAAVALLATALRGGCFVGIGLRLWDVAAGVLLAREAGLAARWWHGDLPVTHVLVGEEVDVAALEPVVADLVARWDPAAGRLIPAGL